ncbi:triosephosphate isomerase [Candidatus Woesearchaeota archaeon]|nr:triosephosphate isomerase [Candidatus Woesearchaeota archaeon]
MLGSLMIVNCKTYQEGTGSSLLTIAKAAEEVTKKTGVLIVMAPQAVDISILASKSRVPIITQHVDPDLPGQSTGAQIIESLKAAGACGSIVNHSERRLGESTIVQTLRRCQSQKFLSVLCAINNTEVAHFRPYDPDFIAVEPPDLIGGDVSVSTANPSLIKRSVKAAGKIPLLVGAGIKTSEDVQMAKSLGARGILIASGVIKAKDPKASLTALVHGFLE